jgi:hypothetical protein
MRGMRKTIKKIKSIYIFLLHPMWLCKISYWRKPMFQDLKDSFLPKQEGCMYSPARWLTPSSIASFIEGV